MKRVLLIIAYSLVTTTNHCAAAAAADKKPDTEALDLLEDAHRRENPFLGNPPTLPYAPALRKCQSDSCLARSPNKLKRRTLKRSTGMNDLRNLSHTSSPDNVFSDSDDDDDDNQGDVSSLLRFSSPAPQLNLPAQKEPLEITSCLGELVTAHKAVRPFWDPRKIVPASALPVVGWIGCKTPWAQRLLPNLFTRSGPSPIVTYSLAILTGAVGLWVAKDRVLAHIYIRAAQDNLISLQRELVTMQKQIVALQKMQNTSEEKITNMRLKVEEIVTTVKNIGENTEHLIRNVGGLVALIKSRLAYAVHIKEVDVLKARLTIIEQLLESKEKIDLAALAQAAEQLLDDTTHLARTDDHAKNAAFAQQVVEEKREEEKQKKSHWWQFGKKKK